MAIMVDYRPESGSHKMDNLGAAATAAARSRGERGQRLMQVWLQVWDPSHMVEEVKLPPLPDDAARATPTAEHRARLLALKHMGVADAQLKVRVLGNANRPLAPESEIAQLVQATTSAFHYPF
jgi:hypothetical protein